MTATTPTHTPPGPRARADRPAAPTTQTSGRIVAIASLELRLFWRNPAAIGMALGMPVFLAGMLVGLPLAMGVHKESLTTTVTGAVTMMALLMGVYYNQVCVFVARREELVLRRWRTSQAGPLEMFIGFGVSALAITVVEVALAVVLDAVLLGTGAPVNIIVMVVGVAGGWALVELIAAWTSGFTKTLESAQMTTLPVLGALMVFSPGLIPTSLLPEWGARVLSFGPVGSVTSLVTLGASGKDVTGAVTTFGGSWAAAAGPLVALAGWLALFAWLAPRTFRWDVRR